MSIATLITSCPHHLQWLEQSIKLVYKKSDYLILGYDHKNLLPPADLTNLCDVFFTGTPKGKQRGETFSLRIGLMIARYHADYVLKLSGDCILEKPDGIRNLPDLLGNDDIISVNWNQIGGTLLFFAKTVPIFEAMLDVPDLNAPQIERRLNHCIGTHKLKRRILPMEHEQGATGNNGIWSELLGFRHLHRETKIEHDNREGQAANAIPQGPV